MKMRVQCQCGALLEAPRNFLGSRALCPLCDRVVNFVSGKVEELAPVEMVDDLEVVEDDANEPSAGAAGAAATEAAPADPAVQTSPRPKAEASSRHAASQIASGRRGESTAPVVEFLDPPSSALPARKKVDSTPWSARMLAALLDPRSIQWMLMIGGVLMVAGIVVWLVSLGVFENQLVVAVGLVVGSLLVHAAGCAVYLKTNYRVAGQALTFLGCVLVPLNLWYLHSQGLITIEDHLWIGGVLCSLLYAGTVFLLRDPLFMYAVEGGVTLTTVLLLASLGLVSDMASLSLALMGLGLVSLHAERAFPAQSPDFPRKKFGMPLFWTAQAQIGAALCVLLGSQTLAWLLDPQRSIFDQQWIGNTLSNSTLIAGGLWLAGAYAWLYSDLVVRRVGLYTYLAAIAIVLAEATLIGPSLGPEGQIAVLAVTALAAGFVLEFVAPGKERIHRFTAPLAGLLSALPVLMGLVLHMRATSELAAEMLGAYAGGWPFVAAMLLVAGANRIGAYICRSSKPGLATVYFFFSAAGLVVAAAGLLRVWELSEWPHQAPLLMVIPLGYLVASHLWRGRSPERPLAWVAQTVTAVILAHVVAGALESAEWALQPVTGQTMNLLLGLVFVEAAVFYGLAAYWRRRSVNVYFAMAAACGAAWQLLGYFHVPPTYYTPLYAALGVGLLILSRRVGIAPREVWRVDGTQGTAMRGPGLPAYQGGNAILVVAFFAAFFQGLAQLLVGGAEMAQVVSLAATTAALAAAIGVCPTGGWRSLYIVCTAALAVVLAFALNVMIDLSPWQKLEIFGVAVGLALLTAGYIAHFSEDPTRQTGAASVALWLGSLACVAPLLIAVMYHRNSAQGLSMMDEMALVTVTVLMLIVGCAARVKSSTLLGGGALALYLGMVVFSLAYQPQAAMGIYLAIGGAMVFGLGVGLSVYREKLLQLPEMISQRHGVFQVMDWR